MLSSNDKLYINVGGKGVSATTAVVSTAAGGYNGGANGYVSRTSCTQQAASGGGATDIRLVNGTWNNDASLNSRIMIAAGGGGAFQEWCGNSDHSTVSGGNAGGLTGGTGEYLSSKAGFSDINPTGGTQINGGQSVNEWNTSSYATTYAGAFGRGATGAESYGGGGSGYYFPKEFD